GSAEVAEASAEEAATAVRAAQGLGLEIAGVDLIASQRGPLVLEVNSTPGLEGIEQATGRGIAEAIIDHIAGRVISRQ
ncbi:MAG TPA: 30S ribosomal protein S6--L-glutamate ligase, partial [Pseudoxanthomonas sp.]|nr:30S ribosomal protein S6--L-glutamate ligase [Pseudoxanthomonas sp.]